MACQPRHRAYPAGTAATALLAVRADRAAMPMVSTFGMLVLAHKCRPIQSTMCAAALVALGVQAATAVTGAMVVLAASSSLAALVVVVETAAAAGRVDPVGLWWAFEPSAVRPRRLTTA